MRQIGYGTPIGVTAAVLIVTAMTLPVAAQTEWEFAEPQVTEFRLLSHARDASWIGVGIRDGDDLDAGAAVTSVTEGSPAEQAGLREGDVVVEFDGERIRSSRHLARVVRETPIGREVSLDVLRDGDRQTLTLATTGHPDTRRQAGMFASHLGDLSERLEQMELRELVGDALERFDSRPGRLGVRVLGIEGQLADYFGTGQGLLVTHVEPSTPAAEAGLRAGDVITMIDETVIETSYQLRRHLREVDAAGTVTLGIVRDGEPLSIRVTLRDGGQ